MAGDQFGWHILCRVMQVPEPVERRTWKALCRLNTSPVQALRFLLGQLSACPSWERTGTVLASKALRPQTLIETIEILVQRRYLKRQDAVIIEECVFASLSPTGSWH